MPLIPCKKPPPLAGLGDVAAMGVPPGLVAAVSFFFDFFSLAAGEALGLSAGLGDASFDASFLERLCFGVAEAAGLSPAAGLSAGDGLCASARAAVNANTTAKQANLFMAADHSQNRRPASTGFGVICLDRAALLSNREMSGQMPHGPTVLWAGRLAWE